ncbi:StbA protein [Desulfosporosinus acidiphilus SJ4]|uniref:StbA protein n=1 Tax=Desulfosporosinus acidiphilus (strain DSM 22704 / JCM 16185 / SJ4) TaxID=646529 RepID=I4DB23_DESAJ|nr:ParM/StbA family protein [Desulfosporosinus acidiphilus]AFM42997.1 StbA protein [Desulfosporosinus acidiphilus SJ4]
MNRLPILAVDVGYKKVKYVSHQHEGIFNAVIAPEKTVMSDTYSAVTKSTPIIVDGTAYWFGKDALYQPTAVTSAKNQRMTTELAKVLVAAAAWESSLEGDIFLSTGLPLDLFKDEQAITEKAWLGQQLTIEKGGTRRKIHIKAVELLPQGIAALLYALSLKTIAEKWPTSGLVTLIDLGERTTDVATVRADTLEPIRGLCFSIEVGVRDLKQQILRIAKQELPLIPEFMADDLLKTGTGIYRRQRYDFTQVRRDSIEQFAHQIVGELQTRFAASDSLIALALLAGGGAEVLGETISRIYDAEVIEEPTMANVLAYYQKAAAQKFFS